MYLVYNRDESTTYVVPGSLPEADWVKLYMYNNRSLSSHTYCNSQVDTHISKKTEHANLNDAHFFLNVSTRERGNQMVWPLFFRRQSSCRLSAKLCCAHLSGLHACSDTRFVHESRQSNYYCYLKPSLPPCWVVWTSPTPSSSRSTWATDFRTTTTKLWRSTQLHIVATTAKPQHKCRDGSG